LRASGERVLRTLNVIKRGRSLSGSGENVSEKLRGKGEGKSETIFKLENRVSKKLGEEKLKFEGE
jgi:hypothetical protein